MRGLRRANVNVSELVRRALREAAAKAKKVKRSLVLSEIIQDFPGPTPRPKRPPLDDRRALSTFVQRKLARRQSAGG